MRIPGVDCEFLALPAPLPLWHAQVTPGQWSAIAQAVHAGSGRLLSLWAGGPQGVPDPSGVSEPTAQVEAAALAPCCMCAAYAMAQGGFWVSMPLTSSQENGDYPDISAIFPAASRLQRAAADLSGVRAVGAHDTRPWLNHGAWPADYFPLQHSADLPAPAATALVDYAFVPVQGEGVHEIPVGPVHAGIIEPGHFRFSIVGEKVLRLEQRLGYTHKGIEQRMTQLDPLHASRLAGRVSGDSTVAYAWAYCMALESATQTNVPERAAWLRALMLERERVANHLGDLGALGNDTAFAFGLAQFSRLREDWLRTSKAAFGHRLMMDCIVPGGVRANLELLHKETLLRQCDVLEKDARTLLSIYEEHPGLQDRFMATGRVPPALAARLGLTGLAGRASGQANDLRCSQSWEPYRSLGATIVSHTGGDVAARVLVRFAELFESLRLIRRIVIDLPAGDARTAMVLPDDAVRGAG
ncbi:MAG: NADH-quinone oxidoreductase subunit C, partial [Rhodoferax sp.]|nr:NADH-quinone oxidoreductase subunit C [Rhodoferax sp.]